jgi:hypothetical protein
MEKTDKRLFALATALIFLSIAWFAQFSQAQLSVTVTDSIVQILDGAQADHVDRTKKEGKPGSRLAQGGG